MSSAGSFQITINLTFYLYICIYQKSTVFVCGPFWSFFVELSGGVHVRSSRWEENADVAPTAPEIEQEETEPTVTLSPSAKDNNPVFGVTALYPHVDKGHRHSCVEVIPEQI